MNEGGRESSFLEMFKMPRAVPRIEWDSLNLCRSNGYGVLLGGEGQPGNCPAYQVETSCSLHPTPGRHLSKIQRFAHEMLPKIDPRVFTERIKNQPSKWRSFLTSVLIVAFSWFPGKKNRLTLATICIWKSPFLLLCFLGVEGQRNRLLLIYYSWAKVKHPGNTTRWTLSF